MKYDINNSTIEVLVALLIIVIISQFALIIIGLRKNHLLHIDNTLEAARAEYRDKQSKYICSKCKRKG